MAKPTPLEAFEENIADAERLIHLSRVLANTRKNRMRTEKRARVGAALGLPKKSYDQLDCVESGELFIVIKPGASGQRDLFTDAELRPLLRQAVVATATAVETYVADKASCYIGAAMQDSKLPARLSAMSVNFGEFIAVDRRYRRRGWGYRKLVERHLAKLASSSSSQVGLVFATVGIPEVLKKVDARRRVAKETSAQQLDALTKRRNQIAHSGDRAGGGRAHITAAVVEGHVRNAKAIVEALDASLP